MGYQTIWNRLNIVNGMTVLVHKAIGQIRYYMRQYVILTYNPLWLRPLGYTPVLHSIILYFLL